jgi:hypothetical protein
VYANGTTKTSAQAAHGVTLQNKFPPTALMNSLIESMKGIKHMTEQATQKAIDALKNWRITERDMIANKNDSTKVQAHTIAKRFAREVADSLLKGGQP